MHPDASDHQERVCKAVEENDKTSRDKPKKRDRRAPVHLCRCDDDDEKRPTNQQHKLTQGNPCARVQENPSVPCRFPNAPACAEKKCRCRCCCVRNRKPRRKKKQKQSCAVAVPVSRFHALQQPPNRRTEKDRPTRL
ncbi:hypothetical protein VTJ04DRAFT_531 [Mycothermus thermophilus]|uniref:uncharacterized protein n=1 Tax=Humicola insolens TaxID=85995 RepID=UPI0037433EED